MRYLSPTLLLALVLCLPAFADAEQSLEADYGRFLRTLEYEDLDGIKSTVMLYRNVKDIEDRQDAIEFLDSPKAGRLAPIRLDYKWDREAGVELRVLIFHVDQQWLDDPWLKWYYRPFPLPGFVDMQEIDELFSHRLSEDADGRLLVDFYPRDKSKMEGVPLNNFSWRIDRKRLLLKTVEMRANGFRVDVDFIYRWARLPEFVVGRIIEPGGQQHQAFGSRIKFDTIAQESSSE